MGLLSFFKRNLDTGAAPSKGRAGARSAVASDPDDVQQLRVRARRRLIGAAVLVAVGVIGFPLVFETQPRPIPVDLPIEIPKKEGAPALVVPAPVVAAASEAGLPTPRPAAPEVPAAREPEKLVEEIEPRASAPVAKPAEKHTEKPAEKTADKGSSKPADKPAVKPASGADAARIQAMLEGREPAKTAEAAGSPRFIVQVGAFAENKAAQDMRQKVEKLGFKTYAQAVQTPDGQRIRVRVGTFPSREEAGKVAAKLHAAGLAGTVLTL
jgi:DedD protein